MCFSLLKYQNVASNVFYGQYCFTLDGDITAHLNRSTY